LAQEGKNLNRKGKEVEQGSKKELEYGRKEK
jgi:hypothetical protein